VKSKNSDVIKPAFLLIGAQKGGTTWLWHALKQHPGASLPQKKEIHFFGGVENYSKGNNWYYDHFKGLDSSKVVGEASTTYLFDGLPYWYNPSQEIEIDHSSPSIPELIANQLPDVKILVILRDPVLRAISGYRHNLLKYKKDRKMIRMMLRLGAKGTALKYPKLRILEYGYYARYLKIWQEHVPPERMRVYIFEEDVKKHPEKALKDICQFLGLETSFSFSDLRKPVHETWSVTRCWLYNHADPVSQKLIGRFGHYLDKKDFLYSRIIKDEDIEFFRASYLSEKEELERILDRSLNCWNYGRPKKCRAGA
jgi:hypothetical protein